MAGADGDVAGEPVGIAGRELPPDEATPVVPDQQRIRNAERVEDTDRIRHQVFDRVRLDLEGPCPRTVAALIDDDRAQPRLVQTRNHIAVADAADRKAMQEQDPVAAFGTTDLDVEGVLANSDSAVLGFHQLIVPAGAVPWRKVNHHRYFQYAWALIAVRLTVDLKRCSATRARNQDVHELRSPHHPELAVGLLQVPFDCPHRPAQFMSDLSIAAASCGK